MPRPASNPGGSHECASGSDSRRPSRRDTVSHGGGRRLLIDFCHEGVWRDQKCSASNRRAGASAMRSCRSAAPSCTCRTSFRTWTCAAADGRRHARDAAPVRGGHVDAVAQRAVDEGATLIRPVADPVLRRPRRQAARSVRTRVVDRDAHRGRAARGTARTRRAAVRRRAGLKRRFSCWRGWSATRRTGVRGPRSTRLPERCHQVRAYAAARIEHVFVVDRGPNGRTTTPCARHTLAANGSTIDTPSPARHHRVARSGGGR